MYFWLNSKTDKDISKISTDSSSTGQQRTAKQKFKKYENPLKNKKLYLFYSNIEQ